MKLALLSDIHANIQAGAEQFALLGDFVGYGAAGAGRGLVDAVGGCVGPGHGAAPYDNWAKAGLVIGHRMGAPSPPETLRGLSNPWEYFSASVVLHSVWNLIGYWLGSPFARCLGRSSSR